MHTLPKWIYKDKRNIKQFKFRTENSIFWTVKLVWDFVTESAFSFITFYKSLATLYLGKTPQRQEPKQYDTE